MEPQPVILAADGLFFLQGVMLNQEVGIFNPVSFQLDIPRSGHTGRHPLSLIDPVADHLSFQIGSCSLGCEIDKSFLLFASQGLGFNDEKYYGANVKKQGHYGYGFHFAFFPRLAYTLEYARLIKEGAVLKDIEYTAGRNVADAVRLMLKGRSRDEVR